MSEILTPLVYQLGIGGIGGFLVGYTTKKIAKIAAVILGIFFVSLIYLAHIDVISLNYNRLTEAVSNSLPLVEQAPGLLTPIISNLPFAGSFTVGLILGLKMG